MQGAIDKILKKASKKYDSNDSSYRKYLTKKLEKVLDLSDPKSVWFLLYDNKGNLIVNTYGKKHNIEDVDLTAGEIPGPRMITIRKNIKPGKTNKKPYTLFIMGKSKKYGERILHIEKVNLPLKSQKLVLVTYKIRFNAHNNFPVNII